MTDSSRQDPSYSTDDSTRDAVALLTVFSQPELDDDLIQSAMENALEGTDHTHLVFNLGMLCRMLAIGAAKCEGVAPAEYVRQLGEAVASSIEENPPPADGR